MASLVRKLKLAFVLFGSPFGWRCSLCGRLFVSRSVVLTHDSIEDIDREFRHHLCWPLSDVQEIEQLIELDERPISWKKPWRI